MDRFARGCAAVLLSMLLAGCDTTTAEEHTANGRQHLQDGEMRAAVIEFKNALQKAPDNAEARMLLGQASLVIGDYDSALKELERALDLGLDNDDVRLGLLQTKLRLGRYQEVVGELEGQGALAPPFAVVLADAYMEGGDSERARALYRQGEHLSEGQLGLGMIAWLEGDVEAASAYLNEAVELDARNWDAWLRLGEFSLSRESYDDAEAAFLEAAGMQAARIMGGVGLSRVALLRRDFDAAATEVEALLRIAPNYPGAHYLDGLVRFERGDMEGAEAAIREVQRDAPGHVPSLYLMGAIKYRQGNYAQAQDNLARFLGRDPANESAAKLLASTQYARGDYAAAVATLEPLLAGTTDPQLLALHGSALMQVGDAAAAAQSLERSVALAPDMAPFRNQLALSLLASGDRQGAEAQLSSAIEVDDEQFQSDYLLAMLRMRDRDWDAAAQAVDALIEKNADSPIGYNLRGAVALGREDRAAARAAFGEALDRDAGFLPAIQNLARLAESEGNLEQAAAYYEDFVAANPTSEPALIALAELALRRNDPDAAVEYLERSVDANPAAVRSGLGLARLHLLSGRLEDASRVVTRTLQAAPELADLVLLQAEIQAQSGNLDGARSSARQLQAQVAGGADNPDLLRALGRLQARLDQTNLARSNLERALQQADGNDGVALLTLARLDLKEGNADLAGQKLEQLKAIAAEHPETRLLEGDLLLAAERVDDARAIYGELADQGIREAVLREATLSMAHGDPAGALERLDGWLQQRPQDLGAQLLSADLLMRLDADRAMTRYESLADTGNPVVLNNLAWLYMQRDDSRAVETARRAVQAAPDNPDVLDTLGWVLLQAEGGNLEEAVEILRRSVQLNPANPSVQYHLGIALREAGDSAGAREALSKALESSGFPEQDDARAALATL